MSTYTKNLNLFKYDTSSDSNVAFSITKALNNNWDIIDEKCGSGNSLLDFKWSDHLLNDMSWLRADTFSWQSGTTYSLAYNELLSEYNNSASVTQTEVLEKKWIQPVLTANGTLGGSSFAVSADTENSSSRAAYKSFDGDYATKWGKQNTTTGNLIFYNPTKIKVTKITQNPVTDYPGEDYGTYTLYGSNNNSTWTQLCQIAVTGNVAAEYIPTNPAFYNYYKISQSGGHNYAGTGELTITATELVGTITYKRTPKGYKIALANQESAILNKYNNDGIAWYYILDTTNKKFKLPRVKYKYWKNASTLPVKGNGMTLGLTNGTTTAGLGMYGLNGCNRYGAPVGAPASAIDISSNKSVGITTDTTKSGIVADVSSTIEETGLYLYFYVGGFTKSAESQTAGLKAEQLNSKVDISSLVECQVVTETYTSGTSGYRIWSDGYCEQWGNFGASFPSWTSKTVTFLKVFKDTNYVVWAMTGHTSNTDSPCINTKTVSSFSCYPYNSTGNACWKACGYLPEGEY